MNVSLGLSPYTSTILRLQNHSYVIVIIWTLCVQYKNIWHVPNNITKAYNPTLSRSNKYHYNHCSLTQNIKELGTSIMTTCSLQFRCQTLVNGSATIASVLICSMIACFYSILSLTIKLISMCFKPLILLLLE